MNEMSATNNFIFVKTLGSKKIDRLMIDSMMDILQLTIYAIKLSIQIHYYNYLLFFDQ